MPFHINRCFAAQFRVWIALCVLIGLASTTLHAQVPDAPSVAAYSILAAAKAATGGANLDIVRSYHIQGTISDNGLTGSLEERDDVLSGWYSRRFTLGPAFGGQGYDGSKVWAIDPSGSVRSYADADAAKTATTYAYIVSMSYWFPNRVPGTVTYLRQASDEGRTFDVLEMAPKGGFPFEMWIDSSSHLIDRTVVSTPQAPVTTYYSNYRASASFAYAFILRQTCDDPKYDSTVKIVKIDINGSVPASPYAPPKDQGATLEFKSGKTSVTVPFQYNGQHIYLPLLLNGHSYSAILDTGGAYVLSPKIAGQLSITPQGAFAISGHGDASVNASIVGVDTVQIGGITVHHAIFHVLPSPLLDNHPIIGYELLNQLVVEVDYDRDTITFTAPDHFHYTGSGTILPFRLSGQTPEVDGSVDGLQGVFTIDSGASDPLDLYAPFVGRNNLFAKYQPKFTEVVDYGVAGPESAGVTRAMTFTLGGATVHNIITDLLTVKGGLGADTIVAGNVGEAVLHQFNVTFDYPHQRIILEPNSHYGEPEIHSGAGITFEMQGGHVVVTEVVPASPAADAGIKVGDIIYRVNGKPVDVGILQSRCSDPVGTQETMVVISGQETRTVTLTIRDLI